MIRRLFRAVDLSAAPSRKRATVFLAVGGYVNTGIVIVQGLLLMPMYLYFIGAHTYGLWLASGGILGMLGLMNFGISSLLIQRVARAYGQKNLAQVGSYFINGAVVYIGICLLFVTTGWVVSIWLPVILKVEGDNAELLQQCFQLAVVAVTIGIFNECLRSFSQALLRPVVGMVGMAVGRIIGIGVTVWMLFYDFGLWAIPAGMLIAEGVIFILSLFYALVLFRKLAVNMSLDRDILKDYLRTSPVLFMARMGNTLSQQSEPLLIAVFISPEVTTAYMITRRAADMVFQIVGVFYGSTYSSFSHLKGEGDSEKIRSTACRLLFIVFLFSLIGCAAYVGANHAFVSLWAGESFVLNQGILFAIGIGFFSRALHGMVWQILYGLGDFAYTSVVILVEGTAKIFMTTILLTSLGVAAVPYALILSCSLSLAILGFRLKKLLSLKISLILMVKSLLSIVCIFGISLVIMKMAPIYDSWSIFILYISALVSVLLLTFILINWRMLHYFITERAV